MLDGMRWGLRWGGWALGLMVILAGAGLQARALQDADTAPNQDASFIGDKAKKVFHRPTCTVLRRVTARNQVSLSDAVEAAAEGYRPCPTCKPTAEDNGDAKDEAKPGSTGKGAAKKKAAPLVVSEDDKKVEATGLERWKKASSDPPDITRGSHFILFSKMPAERAKALLTVMDEQATMLLTMIGPDTSKVLGGAEKISLYVFPKQNAYTEFVRGVEGRELDPVAATNGEAHASFGTEMPYISGIEAQKAGAGAAKPPATTKPSAAAKKTSRTKKERNAAEPASAPSGPERTLAGQMVEQFYTGICTQAGNPPPWLSQGLGAYMAMQVEPQSPYYEHMRTEVANLVNQQPWSAARARDLLNQGNEAQHKAAGMSLLEFVGTHNRAIILPIVQTQIHGGGAQFDELLKQGFGADNVDRVFEAWGQFIAQNYGGF